MLKPLTERPQLGETIPWKGGTARVVRYVYNDVSLFGNTFEDIPPYVLRESYFQVLTQKGEIDFVILTSKKGPYLGPPSPINPLNPVPVQVKGDSSAKDEINTSG